MKIAYMIQAHKNFHQIKVLISALSRHTLHHCFIHIDKKKHVLYKQLEKTFEQNKQVHILTNRIQVNWSGFHRLKPPYLLCIQFCKQRYTLIGYI